MPSKGIRTNRFSRKACDPDASATRQDDSSVVAKLTSENLEQKNRIAALEEKMEKVISAAESRIAQVDAEEVFPRAPKRKRRTKQEMLEEKEDESSVHALDS